MTSAANAGPSATARGWPLRAIAAFAGLALVAYLVRSAGPGRVARVLVAAGPWLPVIAALEFAQAATDVIALRLLFAGAAAKIPTGTWVRSSAMAYAMMVLLPAGRAAGEVARATLIAKHVGTRAAATASVQLSAAYLFGNGLASALACSVVMSSLGPKSPLALLLLGNALAVTASAASLVAVLRDARVGRWLETLRRRIFRVEQTRDLEPLARRAIPWRAAIACVAGRVGQLVQYGVIVVAVGGTANARAGSIAQGIHLVGATLGDLMPNQLGVVDGTYRTFAPTLGFGDAPERALSIAFVVHATQLAIAGLCVGVAAFIKPFGSAEEAPASPRADVHS